MLMNTALRLLRRLLGPKNAEQRPYEGGTPTLLDGATAVAITEALISEAAGLSASAPLKAAELAWRGKQKRQQGDLTATPLSGLAAEGPRGALAAALGQALTGLRATTFLSGPDLVAVQDLLQSAVGQHAPLVIHVGLRGLGGAGPAPGTGHEALHVVAESGAIILLAANVQEAVDFTLIARRVAEQVLLPVLVVQDGEQTALAMQDLVLPAPALLDNFLGRPEDQVPTPIPAQQFLFGEQRRRLPRWHDLDRPILLGSALPQEISGLSQAAASLYLDAAAETFVSKAFKEFAVAGGQTHRLLSRHRVEDAQLILVVQGAAIETAEMVCEQVRTRHHTKVGVLGVRCLRPFPVADAMRLLDRDVHICVLERITAPLASNPPLLRELRATLESHLQNGVHPKWRSVLYGLGGMALRAEDLAALCQNAPSLQQPQVYLGLGFTAAESPYPKRQVLLDRLRRDYPLLANLGLDKAPATDLRPTGCLTISLHRLVGGLGDGLIPELATLLQHLLKGGLRCRPGIGNGWGSPCVDRISVSANPLRDPGDSPPADLALLTANPELPELWPIELAKDGALLILSALPDAALLAQIPAAVRATLQQAGVTLYRIPEATDSAAELDEILGAICNVLLGGGKLDVTRWRLLAQWDELFDVEAGARAESFKTGMDAVRRIDWPVQATAPAEIAKDADIAPGSLRRPNENSNTYQSLPRFWDQVGVLYARGDTQELIPDPYLAVGVIPARSAALRNFNGARTQVPMLDATQCTGCGACWSACPEGAWGATVLSPTQVLDAGLQATETASLRPLANKLTAGLVKQCQMSQPAGTLEKLLEPAFMAMYSQLPFPEERKAAISQDMQKLLATIGQLPLAVTEALFKIPETQSQGALLALALDPDSCKGCAICVQVCTPEAIRLQWQDPQTLEHAQQQHRAWKILPDSDQAARTRLANPPSPPCQGGISEMAALGAALLAPGATQALSGGDGMESGSGARLAMRLLLTLAEAQQMPIQKAWGQETQEVHGQIMATIRTLLTDSLPTDDLETLAQRLTSSGPIDLGDLLDQAEANAATTLDSARLQRLVTLAQKLGDLAGRLAGDGPDQARVSTALVLSLRDDATWGLSYPYNPFGGPVTIDRTGDAPLLAAGILDGQLHQVTADLALLRQARLELEHPEKAAHRTASQITLEWTDLTAEEQAKAGRLLVVGDAGLLTGRALAQLQRLLRLGLPVKVLVLANLDLGLAIPANLDLTANPWPDTDAEIGLLALAHHQNVYIAQSALGAPEHLLATLERLLAYSGPALLHLHAPSPSQHGFAADQTLVRSQDAVASRVFPLFRYDPERAGVFGTRFDLDGNPNAEAKRTPAHWALGEQRFAAMFSPLADNAPGPLALDAYLAMDPQKQRNHTPFVESIADPESRLAVAPELVKVCATRQSVWQMLQELAGTITPFTAQVRQEIETQTAATHEAELVAQAADYEARITGLRKQLQEDTRQALRIRLLELSGYSAASNS